MIGIFSSSRESSLFFEASVVQAFIVLAELGIKNIAYGGGNSGLMGTVYRQANYYGMQIIGHNLERWSQPDMDHEIIYTDLLKRQQGLMDASDMYLVFPGGIGTLYELSQALCHNDVEKKDKPVIIYNSNHVFDTLILYMNELVEKGIMDFDRLRLYVVVNKEELRVLLQTLLPNEKNEIQSIGSIESTESFAVEEHVDL